MFILDHVRQFELNTNPPIWRAIFVSVAHIHSCVYMQMANLADADVSEEDKIKVMLNQSTYDSMKWVTSVMLSNLLLTHIFLLSTSIHLLFHLFLNPASPSSDVTLSLLDFITLLCLHTTLHLLPFFSSLSVPLLVSCSLSFSFLIHPPLFSVSFSL